MYVLYLKESIKNSRQLSSTNERGLPVARVECDFYYNMWFDTIYGLVTKSKETRIS